MKNNESYIFESLAALPRQTQSFLPELTRKDRLHVKNTHAQTHTSTHSWKTVITHQFAKCLSLAQNVFIKVGHCVQTHMRWERRLTRQENPPPNLTLISLRCL